MAYFNDIETFCGTKIGFGVSADAIAGWIELGWNNFGTSPGFPLENDRLLALAQPIDPSSYFRISVTSANGAVPQIRIQGLNFVFSILALKSRKPIEHFSGGWQQLDANIVQDPARAGRIRFEVSSQKGPAFTSLEKDPDYQQTLTNAGVTADEYRDLVNRWQTFLESPAFAPLLLNQMPYPDLRPYLRGIVCSGPLSTTTIGGKVWVASSYRVEAADFVERRPVSPP